MRVYFTEGGRDRAAMTSPAALALCLLAASGEAEVHKETPIQKVTQLMDGMIVWDRDEKQKEQIQFATNEIFCHSIAVSKNAAIKQDGTLYGKPFP